MLIQMMKTLEVSRVMNWTSEKNMMMSKFVVTAKMMQISIVSLNRSSSVLDRLRRQSLGKSI